MIALAFFLGCVVGACFGGGIAGLIQAAAERDRYMEDRL